MKTIADVPIGTVKVVNRGQTDILNVAGGHIDVNFDPKDPIERARAARIVKDMIRNGFVLFIEVTEGEEKKTVRALDFDENVSRYIIADVVDPQPESLDDPSLGDPPSRPKKKTKTVPAEDVRAMAVGRTAGG